MSYEKLYQFFIGLFLIVFLNFERLTSIALIPLILGVLYGVIVKKLRWNPGLLIFIFPTLYLLYFIGFFFTNHSDIAGKYLEYKLSFLIFPLIFCFRPDFKIKLSLISKYYLTGLLIAIVYNLYSGADCYFESGTNSCFFSSNISVVHHPTYFSAFLYLGTVLLIYSLHQKWTNYSGFWVIPAVLILLCVQFLLLSLAGVLFLIGSGFLYLVILFFKKFGRIYRISAIIVLSFIVCNLFFIPRFKHDVVGTWQYSKEFLESPTNFVQTRKAPISGSEIRLCLWTAAVLCIYDHPFGVGTGNVDDVLNAKLIFLKRPEIAELNYNPHNQYLQIAIELGLPVLLFFLISIYLLIKFGWKHKNYILVILVANLAFNMFFESMLQRQSGIVFYTFWICLLLLIHGLKNEPIKNLKTEI